MQDSLRNCSKLADFAYCSEDVVSTADMQQVEEAPAFDLEHGPFEILTGFENKISELRISDPTFPIFLLLGTEVIVLDLLKKHFEPQEPQDS